MTVPYSGLDGERVCQLVSTSDLRIVMVVQDPHDIHHLRWHSLVSVDALQRFSVDK